MSILHCLLFHFFLEWRTRSQHPLIIVPFLGRSDVIGYSLQLIRGKLGDFRSHGLFWHWLDVNKHRTALGVWQLLYTQEKSNITTPLRKWKPPCWSPGMNSTGGDRTLPQAAVVILNLGREVLLIFSLNHLQFFCVSSSPFPVTCPHSCLPPTSTMQTLVGSSTVEFF